MRLITVCFLFLYFSATGQTQKIGSLVFLPLNNENKPKETVYASLPVFENNHRNKGRKIALHIEVLAAKSAGDKKYPVFILMGGPGQAASDLVNFFAEILSPINEHSDIVFIDQRGTGHSNPLKLSVAYNSLQDYFNDEFLVDSIIRRNYLALSQKNDLSRYATPNATLDIDAVRKAMGYERINIYGTSYGTRLALSYIMKYPARVHTATLKGLVPENLVIPTSFAEDSQSALNKLVTDFNAIDSCRNAIPELEKEISHLFNSMYPVKASIVNPRTGLNETVSISRESIALTLRVLLLSPSTTATVPWLIAEFNKGNYVPLANMIITVKNSYIAGLYDGMSLCVTCFEDYPLLAPASGKQPGSTFMGEAWNERIKKSCAIWNPSGTLIRRPAMKVEKTPVLLISAERDPATPPKYGQEVLKYFPNGRHIIIQQAAHSFNGMTGCVENIICAFIGKGNADKLDTGCIDLVKFPAYKLK